MYRSGASWSRLTEGLRMGRGEPPSGRAISSGGRTSRWDFAAGRGGLLAAPPRSGFGLAADVADARGGRKCEENGDMGGAWDCYPAVLRMMMHVQGESLIDRRVVNLHQVSLRKRLATWAVDPENHDPAASTTPGQWWSSASPGPSGMRLHSGHNISTDAKLALWEGAPWPAHRLTDQLLLPFADGNSVVIASCSFSWPASSITASAVAIHLRNKPLVGTYLKILPDGDSSELRRWNDTDRIGFGRLGLDNAARKFQALNNCIAGTATGNMGRIADVGQTSAWPEQSVRDWSRRARAPRDREESSPRRGRRPARSGR